ncbi:MAG: ribonuclease protein component [Frankiales bacterium]|nr:ribonuclease protein component [Frankiales bacterium]
MLARANRLVTADDYRRLVRRGRRSSSPHAVVYVMQGAGSTRFGFIVPKTVGVAVARNRVRRRLKAIAYERIDSFAPGTDVVVRALPGAAQLEWDTLRTEIFGVFDKGVTRA